MRKINSLDKISMKMVKEERATTPLSFLLAARYHYKSFFSQGSNHFGPNFKVFYDTVIWGLIDVKVNLIKKLNSVWLRIENKISFF